MQLLLSTLKTLDAQLNSLQYRCTQRCIDLPDVVSVVRAAEMNGWATTGRMSVPACYNFPSNYTSCDAILVADRIYVALGRDSTSRATCLGLSKIRRNWSPQIVDGFLRDLRDRLPDSEIPFIGAEEARRLRGKCDFPNAVFGISEETVEGIEKVELFNKHLQPCGTAWNLPHYFKPGETYWEHAETLTEARAERERKIAIVQADKAAKKLAKDAIRRAHLLARFAQRFTAKYADARAAGYCDQGIQAWAEARHIPIDSEVPLRLLARDGDPRARSLAERLAARITDMKRMSQ